MGFSYRNVPTTLHRGYKLSDRAHNVNNLLEDHSRNWPASYIESQTSKLLEKQTRNAWKISNYIKTHRKNTVATNALQHKTTIHCNIYDLSQVICHYLHSYHVCLMKLLCIKSLGGVLSVYEHTCCARTHLYNIHVKYRRNFSFRETTIPVFLTFPLEC